jgi:hypothetical protein
MECAPALKALVLKVATPEASVLEPSVVVPSSNVTLPVGAPALEVTLAVKITVSPEVLGLGAAVTAVVVAAAVIEPLEDAVAVCCGLPLSLALMA